MLLAAFPSTMAARAVELCLRCTARGREVAGDRACVAAAVATICSGPAN